MSGGAAARWAVIIPAAGAGRRFGGQTPKVELELAGRPAFLHAVNRFLERADVVEVLLAVAPGDEARFAERWGVALPARVRVVTGGEADRWQTVQRALAEVGAGVTHVAVHDAARPAVSAALVARVFAAAVASGAVVPAVPVADTLVRVVDGRVAGVVDRAGVSGVQTPQAFARGLLERAYAALPADGGGVTDDASVVRRAGHLVPVVPGERGNVKLTSRDDVTVLTGVLSADRGA